jgi:adenylate cyclase, class 2
MEIEIKVKVENPKPLHELVGREGRLLYTDNQVDEYYTPAHRDFLATMPVEEWLRLRDSNGKFSINYKKWEYDAMGHSDHCDELETSVGDPKKLAEILRRLDFKHLITVNKERSAWHYGDYEIAFDEVEGLGSFVEIEWKGSEEGANPEEITAKMMNFLETLGCGKIERQWKGYPHQLLERAGLIRLVDKIA